jgi:hypothetical protein
VGNETRHSGETIEIAFDSISNWFTAGERVIETGLVL